ncbi:hypothetical protein [Kitasatospora sp. A2-31]|nr:hypothetical protein [Kitasatospora sp. A2-31]MCG6493736.1 hypothetical protein [Kitasatospora sp. A2-31]
MATAQRHHALIAYGGRPGTDPAAPAAPAAAPVAGAPPGPEAPDRGAAG